jgi:ATP-binding cassette subfamily C protein CydD
VFAGTVRDNVALGRADVGAAQVQRALGIAALGGVARAHADAPLGEGGQGLSGGEALRLAIARAAADATADLLLVDEPTAHLDRATADDVTERLLMLAQGRTLIVATHDPVLAARLDRRVALQPQGQAAEHVA